MWNISSNFVQGGDGGIYVGSIMKGGAVALDGRIEPGDMILQVGWFLSWFPFQPVTFYKNHEMSVHSGIIAQD